LKRFLRAATDKFIFRGTSIRKKIQASYAVIIILMLILPVTTICSSLIQSARYDHMIANVSKTNRLNQVVKTEISNELWDIVAGNKKFDDGRQYEIIRSITLDLESIMQTTEVTGNRQLLEVAGRAVNTLTTYVDRLGAQMRGHYPVVENEAILDEIRGVAALISDILQEFIVLEIESAERMNERIKVTVWILALMQTFIVVSVTLFAVFAQRSVSRSINRPIAVLEQLSTSIASGDLSARASLPRVLELDNLTENLNSMAMKIQELIAANIREQQNLQKSEMKALQAQITPHFLYNTLDTIIWLAEGQQYDKVIDVTRAFSNFFRISLSKGKEWITVAEEIAHVESYLTIQKIRYRDILDYSVDIEPSMGGFPMLKLVLQPLVENALYHGIKNKRGRGILSVRAWRENGFLCFSVSDNGIGIQPQRLADIRSQIGGEGEAESLSDVYGLYNVNRRLRLYYTGETSLSISSEYRKGTTVSFRVPEGGSGI
jgi:two-component system, sensor histidine kinase YesM